jgi:hypothetical protein
MDHGELNLPLSKRSNIDSDIDKMKALKTIRLKNDASENQSNREIAKELISAMSQERLERLAIASGQTLSVTKKKLNSLAYFNPSIVIKILSNEVI